MSYFLSIALIGAVLGVVALEDPTFLCFLQQSSPQPSFYGPQHSHSKPVTPSPYLGHGQSRPYILNPTGQSYPSHVPHNHDLEFKTKFEIKVEYKEVLVENRKQECEDKDGSYFDPQCFKFIVPEMSFDDARTFCLRLGNRSDIWVPNLDDPYLFNNLAQKLPKVFGSSNNTVWVGITIMDNRFITIQGKDVSHSYLGLIGDNVGPDGNCVQAELITGVVLSNTNCTQPANFVCEFNLASKDEVVTKKFLKYV